MPQHPKTIDNKNIAMHKTTFFLFSLLLCTGLYGQARDTIYIHEERIVYDTVYLHDTIYQFTAAQLDTPVVPKPAAKFVPDVFKGFHFAYTAQYNMTQAAVFTAADGSSGSPKAKMGSGFAGGFEFSYHFAKYFGVAAGVGFGSHYVLQVNSPSTDLYWGHNPNHHRFSQGAILFPLKFEFHIPFNDNFYFLADAGIRFNVPYYNYGHLSAHFNNWGDNATECSLEINRSIAHSIQSELLLDLGFYYRLPNDGLLRFSIGTDLSLSKPWQGRYEIHTENEVLENGTISLKNNYFYPQISYINTFQRYKEKEFHKVPWFDEVYPSWSNQKRYLRHEFQLNFGIPNMQSIHSDIVDGMLLYKWFPNLFKDIIYPQNSLTSSDKFYTKVHFTPVISLSYHYRVQKFLWFGATANFTELHNHYYDRTTDQRIQDMSMRFVAFNLLADIRFSYLNLPRITLYSEISGGIQLGRETINLANDEYVSSPINQPRKTFVGKFPTYHLTALGIKAGAKGWFGNVEFGTGYKGFINAGVGYEF